MSLRRPPPACPVGAKVWWLAIPIWLAMLTHRTHVVLAEGANIIAWSKNRFLPKSESNASIVEFLKRNRVLRATGFGIRPELSLDSTCLSFRCYRAAIFRGRQS